MRNKQVTAIGYAVAAAMFYALNVPCSKLLLDKIAPTLTAAFLYLGAGIGVGLMYLFHHKKELPEERLEKKDIPYTVGMVLLDIIAPILLMIGIKLGTSANASFIGAFLSFVLLQEILTVSYLIALLIMVVGTIFVIADTLVHHHAHVHVHTFVHTHDGTTHKHTITHSHDHLHYFSDEKHGHRHCIADLEKCLTEH